MVLLFKKLNKYRFQKKHIRSFLKLVIIHPSGRIVGEVTSQPYSQLVLLDILLLSALKVVINSIVISGQPNPDQRLIHLPAWQVVPVW